MIDLSIDVRQLIDAKDIKKLYQLRAGQRSRLNKKLGRLVIRQSKKRIRNQKDLRGGSLAKRAKGSKKVLKGMGKGLTVFAGPNKATVTYANGLTGSIAFQHHHGIPELWTAAKAKRLYGQPDYDKPATREQARSLKAVGFKIRAKKGRTKSPSQKWIIDNLTIGQAGALIRKLGNTPSKQTWFVPVQKRQVLGADRQDIELMAHLIIEAVNKNK
ncbi:MAG: hypothetical protein RPT25_06640 [Cycloclasticus sp.]|jgi:hypothetical protein